MNCDIFILSPIKTEISQNIKYQIFNQFSIQVRNVKVRKISCFSTVVKFTYYIKYWFVVLYIPKKI